MKQAREYEYEDHGFGFIRIISLLISFVWTSTWRHFQELDTTWFWREKNDPLGLHVLSAQCFQVM